MIKITTTQNSIDFYEFTTWKDMAEYFLYPSERRPVSKKREPKNKRNR